MHLIVGLGNPGVELGRTRHNIGFLVLDEIAYTLKTSFGPGKGNYWQAVCSLNNIQLNLLKPATYMNNSGFAVQEFRIQQEIPLENILVICDDFQLPLGTIRLRKSGTDGGHNGLSSVIYNLGTDQFARLRCGIGSPSMPEDSLNKKDFVLEEFPGSELMIVKDMIKNAQDACLSYITEGIDQAMNRFNGKQKETSS